MKTEKTASELPRMFRTVRGNSQKQVVRYNHVATMQKFYKAVMRKKEERRDVRVLKTPVTKQANETMPEMVARLTKEGKL